MKTTLSGGKNPSFHFIALCIILFCSLAVTLIQGIPALYGLSRDLKMGFFIILFFLALAAMVILKKLDRLTEERAVLLIILMGMLFHSCYVVLSGLYERQHDEGAYTGIADTIINPGHIGYIEYIYKFRRLPDLHPYQLFSYYHPPLHYVLSGLWLIFLTSVGMAEHLAFENLQVLPLLYSGLFMLVTYHILKKLSGRESLDCTDAKANSRVSMMIYGGMLLVSLHPALTFMSGSVNNDMLSNLLLALVILSSLTWLKDKTLKNLLAIGLFIGLGMLCKINTAVIVFPVGILFLLDFISTVRTKNRERIKRSLGHYSLFLFVCGGIGLAFILRNMVLFHVLPGISSATPASIMYTGDYSLWSRLGMPSFESWHFSFPFHPLSGDVIHNIWVIMFQTSLFAEVFPAELTGLPLFLCQAVYLLGIVAAISSCVVFICAQIKKWKTTSSKDEAVFLLFGYLIFLFSFVAFSLKYPYTCSSDFRYIAICLIYIAAGLFDGLSLFPEKSTGGKVCRIINYLVITAMVLSTLLFMVWRQW